MDKKRAPAKAEARKEVKLITYFFFFPFAFAFFATLAAIDNHHLNVGQNT